MDDATRGADNIRSDIGSLAQRYTVIDREQDCGVCHWCLQILLLLALHDLCYHLMNYFRVQSLVSISLHNNTKQNMGDSVVWILCALECVGVLYHYHFSTHGCMNLCTQYLALIVVLTPVADLTGLPAQDINCWRVTPSRTKLYYCWTHGPILCVSLWTRLPCKLFDRPCNSLQ
jgi:hypothetical protein